MHHDAFAHIYTRMSVCRCAAGRWKLELFLWRETDTEVMFPGFMDFRVSAAGGKASEREHHAATLPFL